MKLFRMLSFSFIIFFFAIRCSEPIEQKIIHPIDTYPHRLISSPDATADEAQIYSQIYETLLTLGADDKTIVAGLARSWNYSNENLCLTITLKKNILFHDGVVLDAEAAKLSIEWLKNNTTSNFLSLITEVETIDECSFNIHLSKPDSRFLYYLASRTGIVMISPRAIKSNSVLAKPVGTGPFYFLVADSINIELATFSNYRERNGNVSKIIYKFFPYSEKLKTAFIKNEVDIVYAIDGYSTDRFQWSGNIKYLVQDPIYTDLLGFNLNNKIARKQHFREAVKYALNLDKIYLNLNRGGAISATNLLPNVYPGLNSIKQKQFNIAMAKKLIHKSDIQNDKIVLIYPAFAFLRSTYIEALRTELGKADINIEPISYNSRDSYEDAIKNDSTALFLYGWKSDIIGDAGNLLYSLFNSESKYNAFQYKNATVDSLLQKSRSEFNSEQRQILYSEVLKIILENKPVIFLSHIKEYYAYNAKKIKSITMGPYGIINYKDVIIDEND